MEEAQALPVKDLEFRTVAGRRVKKRNEEELETTKMTSVVSTRPLARSCDVKL